LIANNADFLFMFALHVFGNVLWNRNKTETNHTVVYDVGP